MLIYFKNVILDNTGNSRKHKSLSFNIFQKFALPYKSDVFENMSLKASL